MKKISRWMKISLICGVLLAVVLAWTLPATMANAGTKSDRYQMVDGKTGFGNPVSIRITRTHSHDANRNFIAVCYDFMAKRLSVPVGGILAFFLASLFLSLFMTGTISPVPPVAPRRFQVDRNAPRNAAGPMRIRSSAQKMETIGGEERVFLFGRL